MKEVVFHHPHRKKHFEFFHGMNHPHFSVTAPVEITGLRAHLKRKKVSFNLGMVFLLSKTANAIGEFRWRIRDGKVFEHQVVHPSYTVPNQVTDVFSFCTVPFIKEPALFFESALKIQGEMENAPSLEDEEGRDDYLFLSALPWIRFTAIQHAMNYHPVDSVPRISWGKFYNEAGKEFIPVSVQAHHGLVDGRHMGMFFEGLETGLSDISSLFT